MEGMEEDGSSHLQRCFQRADDWPSQGLSQAEDLAADVVQLNGARTLLVTPEGRLPPLDAARVQGLAVTLPAHSAAFLQVHFGDDASHARLAAACSP